MKLRSFLIFYCICFYLFTLNGSFVWAELLKARDPQIKKQLTIEKVNQKNQMSLYYQGSKGNYLVFYDFKRDSLNLQYRIDRWDYDRDHIVQKLTIGLLYQVTFSYLGEVGEVPKNMLFFLKRRKKSENNEKIVQKADSEKTEQAPDINSQVKEFGEQNRKKNPLDRKKTLSMGNFISVDSAYLGRLLY